MQLFLSLSLGGWKEKDKILVDRLYAREYYKAT